jgi:hypothetical protein
VNNHLFQAWQIMWKQRGWTKMEGLWCVYALRKRIALWGVLFIWESGFFVAFWMGDLSLMYWWIALMKVWFTKAKKKNAISYRMRWCLHLRGKLIPDDRNTKMTLSAKKFCLSMCVYVCVSCHHLNSMEFDLTKKVISLRMLSLCDDIYLLLRKWPG